MAQTLICLILKVEVKLAKTYKFQVYNIIVLYLYTLPKMITSKSLVIAHHHTIVLPHPLRPPSTPFLSGNHQSVLCAREPVFVFCLLSFLDSTYK